MPTGGTTTYDLTNGIKLDMEDLIHLLSPLDVPLLGGQGAEPGLALPQDTCSEVLVQWLDETILTPRSTLAASITTTTQTTLTVAAGEGIHFQTGDVLKIESEFVLISGYSTTADILFLTRGWNSTAATHTTTGVTIIGVGSALGEGATPPDARFVDRSTRTNVTEIFGPYKVQVSETDQVIGKYGVRSEFDHQVARRVQEAGISIEQAIVYGTRYNDTANKRRTMGGLLFYISTNVDTTTTVFTESAELAALQACFDAGGKPDTLLVGSKQKRIVSGWTSSGVIQVMRPDGTRGTVVSTFESDFGSIRVALDRWVLTADAINFERAQTKVETLRPLTFEMLAKTGDRREAMVVGEKTVKVYRERHAQRFAALT